MDNELDEKAINDWLGENEGFGLRHERWVDECNSGRSVTKWLVAAHKLGRLSAAKSEPVAVKALEWNLTHTLDDGQQVWCAEAQGLNVTYSIWSCIHEGATAPFASTNIQSGFFASLEEGQRVLQADYETRICSALVTALHKDPSND